MDVMTIKVGELKRVLSEESKKEFKPVVFGHEESGRINKKAYADTKKETSNYNGGIGNASKKSSKKIKSDNLGMSDLRYDSINKPFVDNAKSQMKGYVNKQAEDLHKDEECGNMTFDTEGDFYKSAKEHAEAAKRGHDVASEIGLTGRELNKSDIEKNDKTMYESKKIKMLSFKNTQFISEGHVMSKIPDDYKKDGNKFIMRDSNKNEYLVEWNSKEPKITKKLNMNLVNEQKERIKALWEYKPAEHDVTTNGKMRISEGQEFSNVLNKVREMMK